MRNLPYYLLSLLVLLSASGLACDGEDAEPRQAAAETAPERRFSANQVRIEEMAGGRILWTGKARSADGDLDGVEVLDLVLVRHPQKQDERPLTIRAPTGQLQFDHGRASFQDVRISSDDPSRGELHATSAAYDQKENNVVAEGPLQLRTPGLQADAARAVVDLTNQSILLDGPVQGRFSPHAAP